MSEEVLIFYSTRNAKELIDNILDYQIPERMEVFSFVTREKNLLFPNRRMTINDILSQVIAGKNYKCYICGDETITSTKNVYDISPVLALGKKVSFLHSKDAGIIELVENS